SANAQTTIKAVGSPRRFTLRGIPASEFPALPSPDPAAPSLSIGVDLLSRLIARTHFSISTDETRPHVNSALFEWDGDRVRVVTTDGHRLSKAEATVAGSSAKATMLIPLKAVAELRRLADDAKAERAERDAQTKSDSKSDPASVRIIQSGPHAFFDVA